MLWSIKNEWCIEILFKKSDLSKLTSFYESNALYSSCNLTIVVVNIGWEAAIILKLRAPRHSLESISALRHGAPQMWIIVAMNNYTSHKTPSWLMVQFPPCFASNFSFLSPFLHFTFTFSNVCYLQSFIFLINFVIFFSFLIITITVLYLTNNCFFIKIMLDRFMLLPCFYNGMIGLCSCDEGR